MQQQTSANKRQFVLPGQTVIVENAKINKNSFYEEEGRLKSLYFGYLFQQEIAGHPYIDIIKRVTTYLPEKNHFVVGTVKGKTGDSFIIDINSPLDGILAGLQFDGATKRNKPNLNVGDIVYTRVVDYSKFIGARLSCLNAGYSSKKVLGELKGGMMVSGVRGREKELQSKLQVISKYCQFEVAVGKNDMLWFSCAQVKKEMVLFNLLGEWLRAGSEQLFESMIKLLKE